MNGIHFSLSKTARFIYNEVYYSVHERTGSEVRRMNFQRQGGGRMFTNNVFPGVFDDAAQQAYMESTETYTRLFEDSEKYHAIMSALAAAMFDELRAPK